MSVFTRNPCAIQRIRPIFSVRNSSTLEVTSERKAMLDRMIRVDHAGEYGADRIYAGQMAVLGKTPTGPLIQHMWDQEKEHLAAFENMMPGYRVRPTALLPIWHLAGFALGAGSALIGGKEGAMAATVAVESVITEHYNDQIRELVADDPVLHRDLLATITKCRDDEQDHHDTGLEQEAENFFAYGPFTAVVKLGCRGAVWLSERI